MTAQPDPAEPRWLREFESALRVTPQFALWGNVRDKYLVGAEVPALMTLEDALWQVMARHEYKYLLVYDCVDGITVHAESDVDIARGVLGGLKLGNVTLKELGPLLRTVTMETDPSRRGGVVVDYASRLAGTQDEPARLHDLLALCEKLSHTAKTSGVPKGPRFYNPLIWVLDQDRDLPAWLVALNDKVRLIPVPRPELSERTRVAAELIGDTDTDIVGRFARATDGLRTAGMMEVERLLSKDPSIEVEDAVRKFKFGTEESPWQTTALRDNIMAAERPGAGISSRVLGQEPAITKALDILKRSVVGLSGAQTGSQPTRPRGVLFFAGPTGVGKTELAKALTEVIFGDADAMSRFDMSEYADEASSARLIGAPPGYIGHDAGGQLTDAVSARPFRLLLFDEIDKAHPSILDNFLQILDDGRLTDGRGATVHFTECLVAFTSNLGITALDEKGRTVQLVSQKDSYAEVQAKVKEAIDNFFHLELRRPELLNRIGDNVIVFDFIRPEVAGRIFDLMVNSVCARLDRMYGVNLELAPEARERIKQYAVADLSYGGRGIGNRVETALVNPLARALFERGEMQEGEHIVVSQAETQEATWTLTLS